MSHYGRTTVTTTVRKFHYGQPPYSVVIDRSEYEQSTVTTTVSFGSNPLDDGGALSGPPRGLVCGPQTGNRHRHTPTRLSGRRLPRETPSQPVTT